MKYKVVVSPAAEKFLMRLPPGDYQAVRRSIASLADEPWPARSRTVVGSDYLRLRVRRYRIVYDVDTKERVVYVERVARRNENTYKGL